MSMPFLERKRLEPRARRRRSACSALLFAGLSLLAVNALAWWSPEWSSRKSLEIEPAPLSLSGELGEPTVLVRLHQGNFPRFLEVRDGGADLRFVLGDDRTPLKSHVERFDPVSQLAFVWIKLPALRASPEPLYLYFGNAQAAPGDEPGLSYDVATAAVFHFNETQGPPVDATAYATAVTAGEGVPNPASLIGTGLSLPGTQALVLADSGSIAMTAAQGWTFSTWLRLPGATSAPQALLDRVANGHRLSLRVTGSALEARYDDTVLVSKTPLVATQWAHVALVVDPTALTLYVDGLEAGSVAVTASDMTGPVSVGGEIGGGGLLVADLDELKISTVARAADWVRFESTVQGERAEAVLRYGADEQIGAEAAEAEATGGPFGVIVRHVFGTKEAVVEQVVIGVCAAMALVALLVMFLKGLLLSQARRASMRFLRAYSALPLDGGGEALMSLLEQQRRYGDSPLFQVYRQGLLEVRKRLSPAVGAASAGLDEKAMGAIRAAMATVQLRQQQRLSAFMVLLTIAISGGPFIGLFGTVVGVMVTFAAIAASGDVNINAIAPGMAAALLATVAGLGVAIPSLFGYNYLGSKVKELSADMAVYAEELSARVVEAYGA